MPDRHLRRMDSCKIILYARTATETEEDMKEIAHLAEKVARRYYEIPKDQRNGKCQIVASTSFFIPKPFTPFQWAKMCNKEDYIQKAHIVNNEMKAQLNKKSLKYNWHEADVTVLEGVFARGDRRVGKALLEAYRLVVYMIPGVNISGMTFGFRHLKIRE